MIKAVIFDMYETLITHYECPLYFSKEMARDANIPYDKFVNAWHMSEYDRTIGAMTFEEIIQKILEENNVFSQELLEKIVCKRINTKKDCYNHIHSEIIPMLSELKKRAIKVGLISNCFSEEVAPIRESELFGYFDSVCLSYEEKIAKPMEDIYNLCMKKLGVRPEECIYIGDGGSKELYGAKQVNMMAFQACWYIKKGHPYQMTRDLNFIQLESPMDILRYI